MKAKQLGTLGIVFAVGYLIAWVIHASDESIAPPHKQEIAATTSGDSTDTVAALRSDYERQIADLQGQLEIARLQAKRLAENRFLAVPPTEERLTAVRDLRQKAVESTLKLETDRLLGAGFTMDRIEWLRKRSEELATDFRRKSDLLRQQGKLDMDAENAHFYDSDIDLRKEIGDDEYTKYRQAVGRPIGVVVAKVSTGGIGESAGIKPGDQIVAYNGIRVFNMGELIPLLRESVTTGGTMDVKVLRDGQETHLNAAAGDLRVRAEMSIMSTADLGKLMNKVDTSSIEAARAAGAMRYVTP